MIASSFKNRFRVAIASMVALLVAIAAIMIVGASHTTAHVNDTISAEELVVELYELRILNSEYLAAPSERIHQQWEAKFDKVDLLFKGQKEIPEEVKQAHGNLREVFDRLVAIPAVEPNGPRNRLKDQLATALTLESQRVIDWATAISRQTKGNVVPETRQLGYLVVSLILLVSLITVPIMTISARRIISSVNAIKDGAEKIASGELGLHIEQTGDDEMATLANSINRMSERLQESYEQMRRQTLALETEIAERKKVQDQQARLEDQLRQSQKMEAVGLLAGGVAHDFNNILAVIMGYGEMLAGTLPPDGEEHEYAGQILSASARGAELTKGLLAFGMKQKFNLEPTDINQLGADNSKFLKRVIGEDVELVTEYHHRSSLNIMLDRSQMQQVLMNLATNARDAMPGGGELTIVFSSEAIDEEFIARNGFGKRGEYAVVRVSDTGSGMDGETVKRIFEPFFTTKEKGKGTGLGLSIIHGIIAQHNGFIRCDSSLGAGTTFTIWLPICHDRESPSDEPAKANGHAMRGTETILLAEDDAMLMEITATHLTSHGYKVLKARDGVEAVELFTKHEDGVDLVLLDAIMPKMTGKQAWRRIREVRPDVKGCFVSGYANDVISGTLAVDPSVPFLGKPVMPATLLKTVREILDGK